MSRAQLQERLEELGVRVEVVWKLHLPKMWEMGSQLELDAILLDLEDEGITVEEA